MKLKDSLVSSLKFSRAQDADLAWVDGVICYEDGSAMGEEGMECQEDDGTVLFRSGDKVREEDDRVPILDIVPSSK